MPDLNTDIRHHFVRQRIADGQINIGHIGTEDMTADVLTKTLFKQKHLKCANGMGIEFNFIFLLNDLRGTVC